MGESKNGERLVKESKAYAEDYESYMAELITEANFGCCMFQVDANGKKLSDDKLLKREIKRKDKEKGIERNEYKSDKKSK